MKENVFYMIKIKKDLLSYLIDHNVYEIQSDQDINSKIYDEMKEKQTFPLLIFVFYKTNIGSYKAEEIKLCSGKTIGDNKISFEEIVNTNSVLKMENFQSKLNIDLKKDFDYNRYVSKENAIELYNEFKNELLYAKVTSKKNIYNKEEDMIYEMYSKAYDISHTYGSVLSECNCIAYSNTGKKTDRNPFERDRDRIIHSKAFRRLVDKAQIFTSSKGDHYRTRMTHTLEVTQIARSIAKRLNLNESLTEAIALGHDIGHTPFGHQGERTLDLILNGNLAIIHQINDIPDLKQRFKHNYQSLRVLTLLENKYLEYEGLNLTYLTLEGILKHTKIHAKDSPDYDIEDFFNYPYSDKLSLDSEHSITLEGQVVAIADEIAQRAHDIDDAFKSGKINHDTFYKLCDFRSKPELIEIDKEIKKDMNKSENGNLLIDYNDMYRAQLCSKIISYFIDDVVNTFKSNRHPELFNQKEHKWTKKVIHFSETAMRINDILDNMIKQLVLNSAEVLRFDQTASDIITELFKYYYSNPLSLGDGTLRRLFKEMSKHTDNCICLRGSDIELAREEIDKIIKADLTGKNLDNKNEYIVKRKLLARCIADHISGMTDTFAINEYRDIKGITKTF